MTPVGMPLPETYRACVLDKPGDAWALRHVPLEHPGHGEVLIKVICCGFCHTDTDVQQGRLGTMFVISRAPRIQEAWLHFVDTVVVNWPTVPGHEFIVDVVEVGPGVTQWSVGDRVGGAWHAGHDGTCRSCNQGFFQGCANAAFNGVSRPGGFAEYCIVRSEAAVKIPKDADPVGTAPLLCAGVTVFNAMRHQNVFPGETVVIQGLGGLGHLAVQYARKMGYRVVAVSTSDSKEAFALQLGAHHFINSSKQSVVEEIQKLGGAKMVVITAPNPKSMGQYTGCLAWQGTLLILAAVGEIAVNSADLIHQACSVQGWHAGHAQDCEDAIDFATLHDVHCMVKTFPLEKIEGAAEYVLSSKPRFRVVLTM